MSIEQIVGVVAGLLTIVGVIVAATRYITQLQLQARIERLEAEHEQAERARSDLVAANKLLLDELSATRRSGAIASARKADVEEELASVLRLTGAEGGSVYLPLEGGGDREPEGLVFLSILPVTAQTSKLRSKIIPLHSLAGRALKTGEPSVVSNAKATADHFGRADQMSGYQTNDTLTYPLRSGGEVVGVLQLVNKSGGGRFSEDDLVRIQSVATRLARKVDEFRRTPGAMELIGVTPDAEGELATVMFCDLTASSLLFEVLNVSAAIRHINEYFERVCEVVFRHGGTIDKYAGDGVLFRFNVPHRITDHPATAIRCALEVQETFDNLKGDWLTLGEALNDVYSRVGLAHGRVRQALVGHPQYQYLTIFGTSVNAAVNLCDGAPRDRNVILIDDDLHARTGHLVQVRRLPDGTLGKAGRYTPAAYEVVGPASAQTQPLPLPA